MSYTVYVYDEKGEQESRKSFFSLKEAFAHLGTLDLSTKVDRCILDDGRKNLFDLKRDDNGDLTAQ